MRLEAEVIIVAGGGAWALRPPMTQAERDEVRARGLAPLSTGELEAIEGAGAKPSQAMIEALRLVLTTIGGRIEEANAPPQK